MIIADLARHHLHRHAVLHWLVVVHFYCKKGQTFSTEGSQADVV
jgi:hypothetical protein